jgi:predicted TIM-barrel fold metal-dependent hydrolase
MIIDTHVHLYDPTRPEGVPWPPRDAPIYRRTLSADCRAVARPQGVDGVVVVEASERIADNGWVLEEADRDPFVKALVARLEPGAPEFAGELAHYAADPRVRGIRFWGDRTPGGRGSWFAHLDAGTFMADMELLARRGLHLDVPLRAAPRQGLDEELRRASLDGFFKLTRRLPELRVVIEHIGGVPVDGGPPPSQWVEAMQAAAALPQVALKVSSVIENSTVQPPPAELDYYRPVLDTLWRAFGEDRLVYGSNWPVCEQAGPYATAIGVVRRYFAAHGSRAAARYFGANAARIYRWPGAEAAV